MNILTRVWSFNTQNDSYKLDVLENASNLDIASQRLVGGVYTTFRTYQHNKALHLQDHFDRLEHSVRLQGRDIVLPRIALCNALKEIINLYPASDIRFRIHCSLMPDTHHFYLMAEPFTPYPEALYDNGVKAITLEMQRENPASKATNFIDLTGDFRKNKPAGVNEYLMIGSDQTVLEGMSSNIFIVVDRTIWTAEKGILPGITRQMVLNVIRRLNFQTNFEGFPAKNLQSIDEMFITSASRGVMPVTNIDDVAVGNGLPGPVTQLIRSEFEELLQSDLEPV